MLASELRRKYIEFFQSKGHLLMPGASLVPVDVLGNPDNSTLFTSAGMHQFKPYFAGEATPPATRVTTVQKCLRTRDIDSVGDFSHCTFFEMLGNFSFGDYFKADVIPWTWEFLTQIVGLDPVRMCVTVFLDDDEAYAIWKDVIGLPADRIHRLGEDKNYWPASAISEGPNGVCGPCSEIFYRVAPLEEMTRDPALSPTERYLIDDEAGRYVEIWNNVFTQFNRSEDADHKPMLSLLPKKNNDTGAGLDRIAYVSQGKTSVFETDLFQPILSRVEALAGTKYEGTASPVDFAFRVVAEHTRSAVFCIADGILPSNEGRGYVLRYILRRAIRFGRSVLGFEAPFLHEIAPSVIEQMSDFYPELGERKELILRSIRDEEDRFRRTLDNGIRIFEKLIARPEIQEAMLLSGDDAFLLYGTYGFPFDLTRDLAGEQGIAVDKERFDVLLSGAEESGQDDSVFGKGDALAQALAGTPSTEFVGYERTVEDARILAIVDGQGQPMEFLRAGEEARVVLDRTPFYAESGGQVGDTGTLTYPAGDTFCAANIEVMDTHKLAGGIFVHKVKALEGETQVGQTVRGAVDVSRRRNIMRNHTATHLLQAALRDVLGAHVHQKGSRVDPDRLRFDFTHSQPLTGDEIRRVEEMVNAQVLSDADVVVHVDLPIAEARARGAMALFGEKYGDHVRMIEVPSFSLELCGGIHITRTSQVGLFKIAAETGVAAGIRRLEAVTGLGAYEYVNRREQTLLGVSALLKSNPNDVVAAAERLLAQRQELEKQIRQLKSGGVAAGAEELTPTDVDGIPMVVSRLENVDAETVANLVDRTAQRLQSAVILLGTVTDGKVAFAAKVTRDLVARGLHAGNLVREVAKIAGGGGGGRPDFAQAGGRDPGKLNDALAAAPELIRLQLASGKK